MIKTWNHNYLIIVFTMQNAENNVYSSCERLRVTKPRLYKTIKQK